MSTDRTTTFKRPTTDNIISDDGSKTKAMLSQFLKSLNESDVRVLFNFHQDEVIYKSTISVCEHCLNYVAAVIFERQKKVWIKKACNQCENKKNKSINKESINLIENDASFYRTSNKDTWGVSYVSNKEFFIPQVSTCCGSKSSCDSSSVASNNPFELSKDHTPTSSKLQDKCSINDNQYTKQLTNKSCTILVEVTNACNLACRVCYADASGDRILPFEEFKLFINQLINDKKFIDSVQVTGGEATIHPQFWDIITWLYEQPSIGMIYLPTNGLVLSDDMILQKLIPIKAKLLILLQFDGSKKETNQALRRADTLKSRELVIELLAKYGICMQLTMTVAQDISEDEIGWVLNQGLKQKHIRLVGFLPSFYTGRYQLSQSGSERPTLSTVVHAISKALSSKVGIKDFLPIPCSHPNCGWTSLFARRFGLLFNITPKINLESIINDVAYKTRLEKDEIQSVLGNRKLPWLHRKLIAFAKRLVRPKDVFGIAIKPFMDHYNYDSDRVSNCCHHILSTDGQLMSFCEYNTLFRKQDSWNHKPKIHGKHTQTALAIKHKFIDAD
ncbi:radical SAM protein [Pleionea sediminis]|uniref:radical SAM protein n=1 Tax=Pleionea sediminis TaxID=2569479 RepID=UPI001186DEB2|nr:radical SAM protein [Pleionea sediminis]